jgi:hypothetical protein
VTFWLIAGLVLALCAALWGLFLQRRHIDTLTENARLARSVGQAEAAQSLSTEVEAVHAEQNTIDATDRGGAADVLNRLRNQSGT